LPELQATVRGIARFLKPDGTSIHTISHVRRGVGFHDDKRRIELLASLFGIAEGDLASTLQRADRDLDDYSMSAEAFNRLRGSRPYGEFRMRRVVGIQFVTAARDVVRSPEEVPHP
jgi:hypothetical protein